MTPIALTAAQVRDIVFHAGWIERFERVLARVSSPEARAKVEAMLTQHRQELAKLGVNLL